MDALRRSASMMLTTLDGVSAGSASGRLARQALLLFVDEAGEPLLYGIAHHFGAPRSLAPLDHFPDQPEEVRIDVPIREAGEKSLGSLTSPPYRKVHNRIPFPERPE